MVLQFETCNHTKNVIDDNGCLIIEAMKGATDVLKIKNNRICIEEACVYNIVIGFSVELKCPVGSAILQLIKEGTPNVILTTSTVFSGEKGRLIFEGALGAGTKLSLCLLSDRSTSKISFSGTVTENTENCDLLKKTTTFDQNLKIQSITNRPLDNQLPAPPFKPQFPDNIQVPGFPPGFVPWVSNKIPWGPNQQAFPNGNWHEKFQSVQYSVFYYLGLDVSTIPSDSPELTIFIKNFSDRGSQNYLKKVYMSALTCEKMPLYANKIDTMLNEAYTRFTINHEPVISAFKNVLIRFFLDIHIGTDEYPDYVLEYFRTFIDIIGFGDPDRPGRNEAMVRGNFLAPKIKEYFEKRRVAVVAMNDDSSIAYHWEKAGLPIQSLLIECVHNIIAFSQYNNTLYRLVADKLWAKTGAGSAQQVYGFPPPASNPPPFGGPPALRGNVPLWYPYPPINRLALPPPFPAYSAGPVDFFARLKVAGTPEDRLNVVREAYRLLAPNTNAFSKLQTGDPNLPATQSRHIWQQIMVMNQDLNDLPALLKMALIATFGSLNQIPAELQGLLRAILFFSYNPDLYSIFETSVIGGCTPVPPVNPVTTNFDPTNLFEFSLIDNNPLHGDGTVLEKDNPNLFPVFQKPLYLPFGLGYRRCAGETLNMFFTEKMIARFADLEFEVREIPLPPDYTRYQTIGPFTAVPDNIFVIQ